MQNILPTTLRESMLALFRVEIFGPPRDLTLRGFDRMEGVGDLGDGEMYRTDE